MNQMIHYIGNKFLAKHLDLRVRLFNVLAMAGMTVSFIMACLGLFTNAGIWNILINLFAACLAFCLLYYAYKSGKYQHCYMITTVIIFLFLFPILFFTTGGYHSGMPSFFVFAVLFTVFMLEGKKMLILATVEILTYIGICGFAYSHPESVRFFQTELELLVDIVIGFSSVCLALGLTLSIHFRMYRRQQLELEAARIEALRLSNEKSNFLAHMSHEIRTPINVILGMNEVIIREKGSQRVRDYSLNIQNAGKTLLSLIDNILDMSKIESGKLEITAENYKTVNLIDDLAMIGMERVGGRGIAFTVEVDENLPIGLNGDFLHIKQVIVNFLSNAAKYTEQGSVTLKFDQKPGLSCDEIQLCISVSDTGMGIKEDSIALLFDAFNRGEDPANRFIEGTGLGLAIAKKYTELMQGQIHVESHLGLGSTFSVVLPQKVYDHTPLCKEKLTKPDLKSVEDSFIAPEGKVLVVDDSVENLLVVEALLSRTLLQVDVVTSGKACVEGVLKRDYDVILMDYMMPDMDGIETLQALKKIPNFKTPVVVLTANVMAGVKETLIEEGFVDYLSKPIAWKKLEETLMGLLPAALITVNQHTTGNIIASEIQKNLEAKGVAYGINLEVGLSYLSGDLSLFKNIAIYFVENYEANVLKVTEAEAAADWKGLRHLVHSLKSKARTVGAVTLSETAARLEQLCAQENQGYVQVALPLLYYEWHLGIQGLKQMIAEIEVLLPRETEKETKDIRMGELLGLLRHNRQPDALEALEQMIAGCRDTERKEKLKEIWRKVETIEFREAEGLLLALGGGIDGR